MSVTWAAVEARMRGWVGWREGSNNDNPFGPAQGVGNNQAYCDSFASEMPYEEGYRWFPEEQFGERGCAYCPYDVDHGQAHGEVMFDHASRGQPADLLPGDKVFFDWNGTGVADHVETVIAVYADGTFDTIGANTGSPNGVWVVRRDRKYLLARRRPSGYSTTQPQPTPPESTTEPRRRGMEYAFGLPNKGGEWVTYSGKRYQCNTRAQYNAAVAKGAVDMGEWPEGEAIPLGAA